MQGVTQHPYTPVTSVSSHLTQHCQRSPAQMSGLRYSQMPPHRIRVPSTVPSKLANSNSPSPANAIFARTNIRPSYELPKTSVRQQSPLRSQSSTSSLSFSPGRSTPPVEAEATPTVPAKIAYDCLNTLPFNKTFALEYLDLAEPYIEWQSNLEFVKSPPAEVRPQLPDFVCL